MGEIIKAMTVCFLWTVPVIVFLVGAGFIQNYNC